MIPVESFYIMQSQLQTTWRCIVRSYGYRHFFCSRKSNPKSGGDLGQPVLFFILIHVKKVVGILLKNGNVGMKIPTLDTKQFASPGSIIFQ